MTRSTVPPLIGLALVGAAAMLASPAGAAGNAEAAKSTYNSMCASCHGATGKGDGATGASFPTKPRNFADTAWQGSVDDATIAKAITGGGAAVGKSPYMPPFPTLKPDQVADMVALIRSFKP